MHDDVGRNTSLADGLATGRIELRGGDTNPCFAGTERENSLHAPFTVTSLADDLPALVIADGPGENLAGTRRIAINQYDERCLPRPDVMGLVVKIFALVAAVCSHNRAGGEKLVGHFHRSGQQPPRVAAKTSITLDSSSPGGVAATSRGVDIAAGGLLKAREPEIADARFRVNHLHFFDTRHIDPFPQQLHLSRLVD